MHTQMSRPQHTPQELDLNEAADRQEKTPWNSLPTLATLQPEKENTPWVGYRDKA